VSHPSTWLNTSRGSLRPQLAGSRVSLLGNTAAMAMARPPNCYARRAGQQRQGVERIWQREGLKVPHKQPKRGRLWLADASCIRLRPEQLSGPTTLVEDDVDRPPI